MEEPDPTISYETEDLDSHKGSEEIKGAVDSAYSNADNTLESTYHSRYSDEGGRVDPSSRVRSVSNIDETDRVQSPDKRNDTESSPTEDLAIQRAGAKPDTAMYSNSGNVDFNEIDQAVLSLLEEQYRSLRASYTSSADTSNRMIQFLAFASAGLGGFAVNYLLRGDGAGAWMSSLLFLVVLPGTIAVLYLAWVREFLQKARASLLLLRLEGRISRFVAQLQCVFQRTSRPERQHFYAAMETVFGNRFVDSEIWMRGENPVGKDLIEKRAHVAIALVFFVVAIVSMNLGFLVGTAALQSQCEGQNIPPLQQLGSEVPRRGITGLIFPLNRYQEIRIACSGKVGEFLGHGLLLAYIFVLSFGLGVTAYTLNLLLIVRRITRSICSEFYT